MLSKNEELFVTEYTRYLLTHKWAPAQLSTEFNIFGVNESTGAPSDLYKVHKLCLDRAREKGWVSKKELRVLSSGFKTAASFLKR